MNTIFCPCCNNETFKVTIEGRALKNQCTQCGNNFLFDEEHLGDPIHYYGFIPQNLIFSVGEGPVTLTFAPNKGKTK